MTSTTTTTTNNNNKIRPLVFNNFIKIINIYIYIFTHTHLIAFKYFTLVKDLCF